MISRYTLYRRRDEAGLALLRLGFEVGSRVVTGLLTVLRVLGRATLAAGWEIRARIAGLDMAMDSPHPAASARAATSSAGADVDPHEQHEVIQAVAVRLPATATGKGDLA